MPAITAPVMSGASRPFSGVSDILVWWAILSKSTGWERAMKALKRRVGPWSRDLSVIGDGSLFVEMLDEANTQLRGLVTSKRV